MAEEGGEASKGGGLHLEVADAEAVVFERLDLFVLLGIGNVSTEDTALGAIETTTGDGIAAYHIVAGNLIDEVCIGDGYVWSALDGIPRHVLLEGLFELEVTDVVAPSIIIEQTIEADALHTGDKTASRGVWLQAATGADAHHGQRAVFVALLAGLIVDVSQCVEFVGNDVNVVAADAVALAGDALAFISAGDGVELTARDLALFCVEVGSDSVNTGRVANEDHFVGQLLGLQVQMEA